MDNDNHMDNNSNMDEVDDMENNDKVMVDNNNKTSNKIMKCNYSNNINMAIALIL